MGFCVSSDARNETSVGLDVSRRIEHGRCVSTGAPANGWGLVVVMVHKGVMLMDRQKNRDSSFGVGIQPRVGRIDRTF